MKLAKGLQRLIRERLNIDNMQFGFIQGHGITNAIFLRDNFKRSTWAKRKLYFAFVDLEKAFDRVPRDTVWWAMRKLAGL